MRVGVSSWLVVAITAAISLSSAAVLAQAGHADASGLGLADGGMNFPSPWRVIGSFLLVAGLAIAAVYALQRFLPRMTSRAQPDTVPVTVLGRQSIVGGPTVHVIEVNGVKLAIADGKNGVDVAVLPNTAGAVEEPQ